MSIVELDYILLRDRSWTQVCSPDPHEFFRDFDRSLKMGVLFGRRLHINFKAEFREFDRTHHVTYLARADQTFPSNELA